MTRLERDMADLRTYRAAKMSPLSIASVLGRPLGWVLRKLALVAQESGPVPPALDPPPGPDLRILCASRAAPVTRRTVRYIERFLVAGWSTAMTARLFDLSEPELAQVIEAGAA